ncbi:hypothetical protein ONS95_004037 [Cadophora gregata]|uniref:uncharacterized protein n=1 Tax=Cadophora gregata TaxID=51156 RepID=UPI0026DC2766|nr:uncharacterized protein ONS95_004037 [Cadophora gregata]KAK0107344.1 hypothetical protein ONS95_004037 [Cadophora gregata]KAK0117023.1 hypothetical protein ONS96_012865 [Cadophora gregata f. sp. sojae]
MLSRMLRSLTTVLAFWHSTVSSQQPVNSLVSRRFTEYLMPAATETHEFARVPNTSFVLLSQMSNSQLVKIELDPDSLEPIALQSFPMGNSNSGLHGVYPSQLYPGFMWLSLQADNQILLVDPGSNLTTKPTIIQKIDVPEPGIGPHSVFEIGNRVWAGLKVASNQTGKYYVFSVDVSKSSTNSSDPKLYECLKSPVFINEEPTTKFIYANQDAESSIMRIDVDSGKTEQIPIPPEFGNTPVGMTTAYGPLEGVWFVIAGDSSGGLGSFGHIDSSGEPEFFQLKEPLLGTNAGLLHVADASSLEGGPALWLLSTSLLSNKSADALIRVTFDQGVTSILGELYISVPTQNSWVHRVAPMGDTVLVSQLHTFTLAQLTYKNTIAGEWLPAEQVVASDFTDPNETG